MSRPPKPARFRLISHPGIRDDLAALIGYGPDVVAAARAALDDLAHGRVIGKPLGVRRVSGDLTGLASVKFDVAVTRLGASDWSTQTSTQALVGCWRSASATNTPSTAWPSNGLVLSKR